MTQPNDARTTTRRGFLQRSGSLAAGATLLVGAVPAVHAAEASAGELKAAAAVRVVNPTKPAGVVGHGFKQLFSNVLCDLRVQAVVLEDSSGKRLVWMGCDFCVVHSSVVDRMKELIRQQFGIPPEAVCINSSHTHAAPPLISSQAVLPEHWDPQYVDFVVRQAAAVVGDAVERLVPARLRYVEDNSEIGVNRRCGTAGHIISHCPNPKGLTDPSVQAVVAESASDSSPIAVVVKYAGHPVNTCGVGIDSDYPGYMRRIVEKHHPGVVAVFLQGCGGQIVVRRADPQQPTRFIRPSSVEMAVEMAEDYGRQLAESVERAMKKQGTPIIGPIEAEYAVLDLPLEKLPTEKYAKKYSEMLKRGENIPETWPYRLQAFRLGGSPAPFTLVAMDGEVFAQFGLNLGRMLRPATTVVLGYSNGVVGYLTTAKALSEGGYEPSQAFRHPVFNLPGPYTKEVESIVLKAAAELARPKK